MGSLLIVEVADASLAYDLNIKIPLYARHGIPEVWLIDVEQRRLTRFLNPGEGGYAEIKDLVVGAGALILSALPDVEIDLSRLFG